ncbi:MULTISPECIES: hypothetical protein [unclassified Exiguobacterium]|uniref:hypothetical protein n=1 Tax=unclassified Exiguobacterium TaxID=2644629 RepID=UPI000B58F7BD|nr:MULTISPECIES: hypothetical protein [unclassified Exiguobacterium]ASI36607.1 hypothetical protein A0126_13800 [Exiguobacterium sp. N4-1P]
MVKSIKKVPKGVWTSIAALLGAQATFLFLGARKTGRNPWVWGGAGLVQFPLPAIAYFILNRQEKQK